MGSVEPRLETWVRQRGKALYTEDGTLGYELADLTDFFAYWKRLQDEGLTPPADIQSQDASGKMEESMFVTGKALFGFIHSNQLVANQKLVPDEINITMIPNQSGGQPGQYLKPSMLISMAETAPDKEAAAELINFFITDPEANAILQIERGVSGDASIREGLIGGLSDTEKKIIDYLDVVATSCRAAAAAAAEERRRARPGAAPGLGRDRLRAGHRRGGRAEVLRRRRRDPGARLIADGGRR